MSSSKVAMATSPPASSSASLPETRVLVIGTGGTICMQEGPDGLQPSDNFLEQAMEPRPSFNDMSIPKTSIPAVQDGQPIALPSLRTPKTTYNRHVRYSVLEFSPLLDSSSMDAAGWRAMAHAIRDNYQLFDGFVILHGTDSLAHTASALSFMLCNLGKTVVLTGSQSPIFALQSDAFDNLLGSLIIAGTFIIPEVSLFFHHKLYRGNRTTKISATNYEAFASSNCDPLAKVNGLGIDVNWSLVLRPTSIAPFHVQPNLDSNHVARLRVWPGIRPEMIDSLLSTPGLRGLVLETFGMGNVPGDIISVLGEGVRRGIVIISVSQCVSGTVSPVYAPGTQLGRVGVIFGLDLTTEAAIAKLSYLFALPDLSVKDITKYLTQSLRGEMTEVSRPVFSRPNSPLHTASALVSKEEVAFTALGNAIRDDDIDTVSALLRGDGAQLLEQADYAGNTAVHIAAVIGCTDVMRELLNRGASVHERNRANNSPLFLATLSGQDGCAELLRAAGAHLSAEELQRQPLRQE